MKNRNKRKKKDSSLKTKESNDCWLFQFVIRILLALSNAAFETTLKLYFQTTDLASSLVFKMIALGTGDPTSSPPSDKKKARLLNKQNKLMAEYRLVTGKDGDEDESSSSAAKKIKLDTEEVKREKLNPDEFKAMKLELAERKRMLTQLPRFTLNKSVGLSASVFQTEYATRIPLLFSDIQQLVTYGYGGNAMVPPPSRWCQVLKPNRLVNILLLIVDGLGLNEFVDNEDCFSRTMNVFGGVDDKNRAIVEFLSPHWYGGNIEAEMLMWGILGGGAVSTAAVQESNEVPTEESNEVPTEVSLADKKTSSSEDQDAVMFNRVVKQIGSVFRLHGCCENLPHKDVFPRTNLILTIAQLIQEAFPLPIPVNTRNTFRFTPTSENYKIVNSCSKMFSIDCEMCCTVGDPQALAKVAIVDEELQVIYDTLVKPKDKITDYLTRWSGITKEMLEDVTVTLDDVQSKVKEIVSENPDCIFIGQSLNCDLKAMRMTHPYIIDTSVIFNLTGIEGRKSSLKDLALNLLDEEIQVGKNPDTNKPQGHCPVEDATAAMKLVKLKLSKGFTFGNEVKNGMHYDTKTVIALDPAFAQNSLTFKKNKMEKDVLVITQSLKEEPPQCPDAKLKTKQSSTNKETVKLMLQNCFNSFMTVGFYKIDQESLVDCDAKKAATKLDKRIKKLFNCMCVNSMIVVACTKGSSVENNEGRRNNGVCFVRVKSGAEVGRVRKDD